MKQYFSLTKVANLSMEEEKFYSPPDVAEKRLDRIKNMTTSSLLHALKDLNKVIEIQEKTNREGGHTPKLGYYHDEKHEIINELNRRRKDS